jgi:hypothetical protein
MRDYTEWLWKCQLRISFKTQEVAKNRPNGECFRASKGVRRLLYLSFSSFTLSASQDLRFFSMKSLFDQAVQQEIVDRLCALTPTSERLWGKMVSAQMMAHCTKTLSMATGEMNLPRALLGRILGPLFRPLFVGEKEFRRNGPTAKELVVDDPRTFDMEKDRLLQKIRQFGAGGATACTRHPHPFFGELTPEEWGAVMFKHLDHHFRQFGG